MFLAMLTQPRSAGQKTAGRQIFTRFRLNRSASRACATDAQAIATEVGGHVESVCCRSCCFRSFCRVLQPTQYLACALFDVDVDATSLRLPLSLDGSRSPGGEHKVPNQASLDRTKGGKSKVTKGSRPPQVRESRYAQQVGPGDQFPRRRGFFGRLFGGPTANGPQGYYRPPPTRGY
jgi:hypothetical protein